MGWKRDELEKIAEDGEYRIYAPPIGSDEEKKRFLYRYERSKKAYVFNMGYFDKDNVR